MKKNRTQDQEQKRNPRRLSLNRETLRFLDDPKLLEFARGGRVEATQNDPESTSQQSLVRC